MLGRVATISVAMVLLSLCGVAPCALAEDDLEGWEGLSQYRRIEASEALKGKESKVLLYYFAASGLKAVRFNLLSHETKLVDTFFENRFLCLMNDTGQNMRVSACRSTTGKFDAKEISIESIPLFSDTLRASEVDASKVLVEGRNEQLWGTYAPYISVQFDDEFLAVQRIGSGDFVAQCSSLQLTSSDGLGAVVLYTTSVRPHFRGTLASGVGGADQRTKFLKAVHLAEKRGVGYRCDEVATLPSNLVVVLSADQIVVLNYAEKTYAMVDLPIRRRGFVLFSIELDE